MLLAEFASNSINPIKHTVFVIRAIESGAIKKDIDALKVSLWITPLYRGENK